MRVKSKLSIVAFFSCCAVASMGFANWVISQQGPYESITSGSISADSVYYSNAYVYINEPETDIVPFTYSSKGFIDKGTPSNVGTMTATFTVDLEKCSTISSGSNTLNITVDLKLSSGDSTLFDYVSVSCADDIVIDSVSGSYSGESGTYAASMQLNVTKNSIATATFTLTYTFNMLNQTNFNNYIYKVFGENNANAVEFIFSITINTND